VQGSPAPVLVIKEGESVVSVFFKINLSTTTSMTRSIRELSIDMVIGMSLKVTKLRSSPVLPSNLKQVLVFTLLLGLNQEMF